MMPVDSSFCLWETEHCQKMRKTGLFERSHMQRHFVPWAHHHLEFLEQSLAFSWSTVSVKVQREPVSR
jgi:hypothetical protein